MTNLRLGVPSGSWSDLVPQRFDKERKRATPLMEKLSATQKILVELSSLSDVRQQARVLKTNMATLPHLALKDLKSSRFLEILLKVATAEHVKPLSAVSGEQPGFPLELNAFTQTDDLVVAHSAVLEFLCKRLADMTDEMHTTLLNSKMSALIGQSFKILALDGLPRALRWAIRCQQIRIQHGLVIMLGFQNTLCVTHIYSVSTA